jgi:type IV pilus assembly protein PilY1
LTDVVMYYWNRDLRPGLKNSLKAAGRNHAFWQHMSTYIVGYGVSASMDTTATRTEIEAGAPEKDAPVPYPNAPQVAWPAVNLANNVITGGERINDTLRAALIGRGNFYSANDPQALRVALNSAFLDFVKNDSAGTAVAVTSPLIMAGGIAVQSKFTTDTWVSELFAYDSVAMVNWLRNGMAKPSPVWTANFPAWGSRNVVTSTAATSAVGFDWGNLSATQKTDLNNDIKIYEYLRGSAADEPSKRARSTLLGDIVNSGPLLSKALDQAYQMGPAASSATPPSTDHGFVQYRTYVTAKKSSRKPTVMVGANDGMFHIFDADVTSLTKGTELFAYVPRSVYPILKHLADPGYQHRYYVDGPVIEGDVSIGDTWKTVVVGSTGAGPRGLFALDVTDPTAMNPSKVLWDLTSADEPDLGHVLGAGVIGSIKDQSASNGKGRWVALIPNGYESDSHKAVLLVIDVLSGSVIKKIDTGIGDASNKNGLGPVTPVYDGNRNIVAVYGGDKLGNLWKFDFSSKNPTDWKIYNEDMGVKPLFTAKDEQGTPQPQPISTAPRITVHPRGGLYVTFGTGKLFEVGDPADVQLQTFYALRDTGQKPPIYKSAPNHMKKLRIDQVDASGVVSPVGQYRKIRAADLASLDWNLNKGWYINLRREGGAADGERIIAPPILDAGILSVTSYVATTLGDECRPGANSYLYRFDLANDFERTSFLGVTDNRVVGKLIETGSVGGLSPVYEQIAAPGPLADTMAESDLTTLLGTPKYQMSGNKAVQQGAVGQCTHVGLRVDGSMAAVPTQCAGLMPLRVWRPIR